MNPFLPAPAGAGLLSAPATLPDERLDRLDDELLDLLCRDEEWLDETFHEIVAASWAEPPRGGEARSAARPRRSDAPPVREPGHGGIVRSQWSPRPYRRQRSPPGRRPWLAAQVVWVG